jgi:Xaa-Pro aminopeptidase
MGERDWRYRRIRAAMAEAELDGLLAHGPRHRRENVRYLTGARLRSPVTFAYLPLDGDPVAFVDSGSDIDSVWAAGYVEDVRPLFELPSIASGRLGLTHADLLAAPGRRALEGADLVPATELMDRVRLVKSDWEIGRLRRAASMCDDAWATFLAALRPGVAEFELRAKVEASLLAAGAEDNLMLVASGGDEVRRLSSPSDRRVREGDMVRVELTPQVDGYWAQICRSAVVGDPSPGQRDSFALFDEATAAGLDALHPGVTAHEVAKAQNDVLRRHGFGAYCGPESRSSRGHGHGLRRDEVPIVEQSATILEEKAVVIVHPNAFTPLAGYHVLGDPVVVGKDGPEPLLRTARALDSVH